MKRLRLTPEAEFDLDEAYDWYRDQAAELAVEFLQAVNRCIESIHRQPEAYQLVDRTMRRALLRRFPYAVFFEVGRAEIVVYAVFHGARDPRAWKRRLSNREHR